MKESSLDRMPVEESLLFSIVDVAELVTLLNPVYRAIAIENAHCDPVRQSHQKSEFLIVILLTSSVI